MEIIVGSRSGRNDLGIEIVDGIGSLVGAIMETEFVLQRPQLMQSLVAAEDDIVYGRVTAQQEGESIDQLLDRVSCTK